MATALLVGGGLLAGGLANAQAADIQSNAAQRAAREQQDLAAPFVGASQTALQQQLALLGQGTPEEIAAAQANIERSPLNLAVQQGNEEALQRRGISGGAGTGSILDALQKSNQSNLLNTAFSGFGQVARTGMQALPGAQQAIGAEQAAIGAGRAAPFSAFSNALSQGAQLASFGGSGGFGGFGATPGVAPVAAPASFNTAFSDRAIGL